MELTNVLEKVAKKMTSIEENGFEETCPIGIINIENWEWPQGVGTYGLYKYYKELGKTEYKDYLNGWYDRQIAKGLPGKNVNTMSPMLTLMYLAEETGNETHLALCREWAEWVITEMPRTTKENVLQHIVSGLTWHNQAWIDTLYMTVLFLAKAGMVFNRPDYIEEAKYQFLMHIKYLADKKTGLWFHVFNFEQNEDYGNIFWCRGNSWYTAGVCDFIEIIGLEDGAIKEVLIETLIEQVKALEKYQHKSGLWHTIIDDPTSYLESSGSAAFAYGILKAVRKGYIDKKYAEIGKKALIGVLECVEKDGTVNKVSYGTGVSKNPEDYKNIPLCPMTYGQALPIHLFIEAMNLNG